MTIPKLSVFVLSLCLFLHGLPQAYKKPWSREVKLHVFGYLAQADTSWNYRIVKPPKKGKKAQNATIVSFEFYPSFPDIYMSGQAMQDKVDCYTNFLECILQNDTTGFEVFDFHFNSSDTTKPPGWGSFRLRRNILHNYPDERLRCLLKIIPYPIAGYYNTGDTISVGLERQDSSASIYYIPSDEYYDCLAYTIYKFVAEEKTNLIIIGMRDNGVIYPRFYHTLGKGFQMRYGAYLKEMIIGSKVHQHVLL